MTRMMIKESVLYNTARVDKVEEDIVFDDAFHLL